MLNTQGSLWGLLKAVVRRQLTEILGSEQRSLLHKRAQGLFTSLPWKHGGTHRRESRGPVPVPGGAQQKCSLFSPRQVARGAQMSPQRALCTFPGFSPAEERFCDFPTTGAVQRWTWSRAELTLDLDLPSWATPLLHLS